jgi:2-polyprenyl-3-methyl-5-hydroxy-6-metoxy-1,4-benzoquinol methylase
MDKREFNKAFYNKQWAKGWKSRFMYDPISKRNIARYVLKQSGIEASNKNILDIGFGFGIILFSFNKSNHIHGIELSESAVEYARKSAIKRGFHDYGFRYYDGSGKLPAEDGSYDLVICSHVLEHVPDDNYLLSEIKRVMKPDGIALLNIPINEEHFADPRHMRKYTTEAFLRLVASHGLSVRFAYEGDRMWNIFGWFFEKDYHKRIPVLGFMLSSIINICFSCIPFVIQKRIEEIFLHKLKPRQFAMCVTK